ncbi:phosphotransferase [Patescibacteria group bacterium]
MKELDPRLVAAFLTERTNIIFPPGGDTFEDTYLENYQVENVMTTLGMCLGEIHKVEGYGYGLINSDKFAIGELVGRHSCWSNFILDNTKSRFDQMKSVLEQEEINDKHITELSDDKRKLMMNLLGRSKDVLSILEKEKKLMDDAPSSLLYGNVHLGNIVVDDGKLVGLRDFEQPLIGDPVDDLAYFSVMPEGEKYLSFVLNGWKEVINDPDLDKKLHLYRLIESYRKIYTRYINHHSLQDYSEPLSIAQKELRYYNIS